MRPDPTLADPNKIASFGDDVERHYAARILKDFLPYATIWATFIGNNGKNESLQMSGSSDEANFGRRKFWTAAYTLFESLALCWALEDEFLELEKISDVRTYAKNLNNWLAYFANLGRIYDMTLDCADQIGEPALAKSIKHVFELRSVVLHGPKVPMRMVNAVLQAPPIGEAPGHWHDKMEWKDLTAGEFKAVWEHMFATIRELEVKLSEVFTQILPLLRPRLGLRPVEWPTEQQPVAVTQTTTGTVVTASYQESPPAPGVRSRVYIGTPAPAPRFTANTSGTANVPKLLSDSDTG